ncbi:MAG: hypothetical protein Q7U06_00725 [Pseudomonadota bacterium]|nr:hypothetical protein [Pseudomonadota bacterium]
MVVVADTSPHLYLFRVGALEFLAAAFGEMVCPRGEGVRRPRRRTPEAATPDHAPDLDFTDPARPD